MMQRLTWLVPLVLLQGCAGTPLAERLETSFGAQDAALLTAPDTVVERQAARSVQANPTGSAINDSVSLLQSCLTWRRQHRIQQRRIQ